MGLYWGYIGVIRGHYGYIKIGVGDSGAHACAATITLRILRVIKGY